MFEGSIGKRKKSSPKFEVNFVVRDKSGKPTSKRKTFASNSAQDMSTFFNKHSGANKGKGKRGKRGNKSSSGESAS